MKKLLKVLAVAIFALTPLGISSSASAQAVCDVGFTGPDSQNLCTSVTKYSCTVKTENTVEIIDTNNQSAVSGTVNVSGNGQAGGAASGSVTNTNGTTFVFTITNPLPQVGLGSCVASAVVPAVQPPAPTPATPNPVQPTATGRVSALPHTSSDATLNALIITVGSLALIATLGVGGIALYRYYKSL
ncbi:MAG: hypothetical protein JWN28_59 [Candidatus Saccharibacteria bacterium]|nr:hypothetical protein [Candidatus Saccharibacteria bacterium]